MKSSNEKLIKSAESGDIEAVKEWYHIRCRY